MSGHLATLFLDKKTFEKAGPYPLDHRSIISQGITNCAVFAAAPRPMNPKFLRERTELHDVPKRSGNYTFQFEFFFDLRQFSRSSAALRSRVQLGAPFLACVTMHARLPSVALAQKRRHCFGRRCGVFG
jgi:hypothetical protein